MIRKNLFILLFFYVSFQELTSNAHNLKDYKGKKLFSRNKRAAVGPLWPFKKIPYAFSNIIEFDFNDRKNIRSTLTIIQESLSINGETCLEFVERHNENDYILFVDKGDCSSGIGFYPGINQISLSQDCLNTGTIIHEIMHRLGFDHEHSRPDRDENVVILLNNTISKQNFELSSQSSYNQQINAPYDYHSIIHYDSNSLQNNKKPTILSKNPVMISNKNEIFHNREKLSPIDVFKIQKLYKCKAIDIPQIFKEFDNDEGKLEKIRKRFKLEASFNRINDDLVEKYLNKSYNTCGMEHYWPINYPLVDNNHRLYRLMCERKKKVKEDCHFSIECKGEDSICVRPFFKKVGICVRPNNNRINEISQTVNDSMFQYGKTVKDVFSNLKNKFFG